MAGFLSAQSPQYITPNGSGVAAANGRGLLGLFPGTPEYAPAAAAQVPASPGPMPMMSMPPPVVAPAATSGIEIRIAIPGLLNVQGSLSIPPWLPELSPVLVPVLLNVGRRWLELKMCEAAAAAGERPSMAAEPRDDAMDADVER